MTLFVLDTNVIVSGLVTRNPDAPTARLVDLLAATQGQFALSTALLAEYRDAVLRPRIAARHGLSAIAVDALLLRFVAGAVVRAPARSSLVAPDPKDQFVVDLAVAPPACVLVTGDGALHSLDGPELRVVWPRQAAERLLMAR